MQKNRRIIRKRRIRKNKSLYLSMLFCWTILLIFLSYETFQKNIFVDFSSVKNGIINVILFINYLFLCYFWLNGVKDTIYVIWFYLHKNKMIKYLKKVEHVKLKENPRVILLYCTCDDFCEDSLKKSMNQNYSNYETIILDDSVKQEYIERIDKFSKTNDVKVIRREGNEGFKAGNINNYLKGKEDYDYFVILDSDEIIPQNFIRECLKYFQLYKNLGILQCNHIATRNENKFMDIFHIGVNSHWPTYQTTKHFYGFMSMLGHGAMIPKDAYKVAGGFPHVVAEDLCISIELRNHGYFVGFAPNIVCEEQYPVDYLAFKKRHSKWTQGNMEFIKRYTIPILKSKMKWFEKLDIFLFTYNLPLTAFFSLYIFINVILLPVLGYELRYGFWMLFPTIIFFLAPMLNDIITYITKMKIIYLIRYCFLVFCLYGSMLWVSLYASLRGMFGIKAIFIVTPKKSKNINLKEAFFYNKAEIYFALILSVVSIIFSQSIFPVILITVSAISSVWLTRLSNK